MALHVDRVYESTTLQLLQRKDLGMKVMELRGKLRLSNCQLTKLSFNVTVQRESKTNLTQQA